MKIPSRLKCLKWPFVAAELLYFFLLFANFALLGNSSAAHAAPIYVYTESDGTIHFTDKKPPSGVTAKVFTARQAGFSVVRIGKPFNARLFAERYRDIIRLNAISNGLSESLLKAVIHVESGFDPKAISKKGALGLMQLMPTTAKMHGVSAPFEPLENIRAGARHLANLLRRYRGDVVLALAAYNAGEGAVEQYGGVPPFSETKEYIRKVLDLRDRYIG